MFDQEIVIVTLLVLRNIFTIFSLTILAVVVLVRNPGNFRQIFQPFSNPELEGLIPTVSPQPPATSKPTVTPKTSILGKEIEIRATSTPIPTQQPATTSLFDFQYPGATVISSGQNSLKMESTNPIDAISEWYKEKLKKVGYNAVSIVETSTNGNVLNTYQASEGGATISIEIRKNANSGTTSIEVSI